MMMILDIILIILIVGVVAMYLLDGNAWWHDD